jgi:hypothetical protein
MTNFTLNKMAARLASQNIFVQILIGAVTTAMLVWLNVITTQEDVRNVIGLISLPLVLVWLLNGKCCKYFYGEEKFRNIMPVMGKNIGIPNEDPHFYHNIISGISAKRKLAGYVYVISKLITCFFIGAMMMWVLIDYIYRHQ